MRYVRYARRHKCLLSLLSPAFAAGRRSADMPSPGREQGPLDPATKVLEMESLGVKVSLVCPIFCSECCQDLCSCRAYNHCALRKTEGRGLSYAEIFNTDLSQSAGTECEAVLGAKPHKHGLQLCMGSVGHCTTWQQPVTFPLLNNDWCAGPWQAV